MVVTGQSAAVIPEIDIWRVADLMLHRYGSNAELESARRADEFWDEGDTAGVAVWRRIIECHRAAFEHDAPWTGALIGHHRGSLPPERWHDTPHGD